MSQREPSTSGEPAIEVASLVRGLASRQPRLSGIRLTKLAYLAEVRYAAGHGRRLTNATWSSWKFGPYSQEVIDVARSLPKDQLTSSTEEVLGKVATYYRAGTDCRPDLPDDVGQLLDDLIAVYGHEDTTMIVSAAYRSTPFQRTPSGRRIDLDGWATAMNEALHASSLVDYLQGALRSERRLFSEDRELVEFLAATRKSSGAEA